MEKIVEGWEKLHEESLYGFYSSSVIVRIMK